jgi:hypothetical protein
MKPFEFALVIVSVIIGLALTELAIGVADMIRIYRSAHIYWAHILLCTLGLVTCINYWATLYKLRNINRWPTPNLAIVVIGGLLFFILGRLLFPEMSSFDKNYERYFHENVATLLTLNILFIILLMLEAFMIRKVKKLKSYFFGMVFIAILFSGVVIDNKVYREILTVIYFTMYIYFMFTSKVIIYDNEAAEQS